MRQTSLPLEAFLPPCLAVDGGRSTVSIPLGQLLLPRMNMTNYISSKLFVRNVIGQLEITIVSECCALFWLHNVRNYMHIHSSQNKQTLKNHKLHIPLAFWFETVKKFFVTN